MRNPLTHRYLRELKDEKGKYIALFLFLFVTIGFCSGFLVADRSMKDTYDNSFNKYNIEDGHFSLAIKIDDSLKTKIEDKDVKVDELFYKNLTLNNNETIRIFKDRDDVDKVCIMSGENPKKDDEIAIDRLYAENNNLSIGDNLNIDDKKYKICGTVALSDYSALFENNNEMMFNAQKFCVGVTTKEGYEKLDDGKETYCYTWKNNKSLDKQAHFDKGEEVFDVVKKTGVLTDFLKREDNQSINFTGDDMGSDKSMVMVLLYILIVVLAFIFAITTRNTLEKEAGVIGTLRASGYTKGELLRHYLTLPTLVTLVAAVLGNIVGYTFTKTLFANMYYHSYSLTTYTTVWDFDAFILTTVIPLLIILLVNILVLLNTLSYLPLQFIRRELSKNKRKKVIKLKKFNFKTRFRTRIILQNIPTYITMFIGILFASILLLYGFVMNPILTNYKEEIKNSQIAKYQYVLKAPSQTKTANAEKYCLDELKYNDKENITVFGIDKDSQYLKNIKLPEKENEVIVSNGFMEKYGLKVGETIKLDKEFKNKNFDFKIIGTYDYPASLAVFLQRDNFNKTFSNDESYYSGYFSDKKLTDIDKNLIATTITIDDLTKLSDQLDDSLGGTFSAVAVFAMIVYIIIIFLLAKLIIEKNSQSISMIKILGYDNKEVSSLYNMATAIAVLISIVLSIPISLLLMKVLFHYYMQGMNGWITYYIAPWIIPCLFISGVVCYFLVHLIEMSKIKRIPMSQALKNQE